VEAVVEFTVLDDDAGEPDGRQPRGQRFRVDRDELVSHVSVPGPLVVVALRADQDSPGAQHPPQFGEDTVLNGRRLGVMEDGEGGGGGKPVRREPGVLRAAVDDLDVAARQAPGELRRQAGVDLHRGDPHRQREQHFGGQAGARADLEHVVAQVADRLQPGAHVLAQQLRPAWAGQHPQVALVHRRPAMTASRCLPALALLADARPACRRPPPTLTF
jgi:hypothetical protein